MHSLVHLVVHNCLIFLAVIGLQMIIKRELLLPYASHSIISATVLRTVGNRFCLDESTQKKPIIPFFLLLLKCYYNNNYYNNTLIITLRYSSTLCKADLNFSINLMLDNAVISTLSVLVDFAK